MVTFILIAGLAVLVIGFGALAYSSNNRKRAGQKGVAPRSDERPSNHRATGND